MSGRKYSHILWDFNGTMFNDTQLLHELVNEELLAHGKPPITMAEYLDKMCHPVRDFYERIGVDFMLHNFDVLSRRFHSRYISRFHSCSGHSGLEDLLGAFKQQGFRQSILSALPHDLLLEIVGHFAWDSFFADIQGHPEEGGGSKVAHGRELLERSMSKPAETIIIGDTLHDAEVAEALGIDCLLVSHGVNSRTRLAESRFPIVDSLAEVEIFVLKECHA